MAAALLAPFAVTVESMIAMLPTVDAPGTRANTGGPPLAFPAPIPAAKFCPLAPTFAFAIVTLPTLETFADADASPDPIPGEPLALTVPPPITILPRLEFPSIG
jgi:hypothetical protein